MESKRIRSILLINGTHEAFNGKQRGEPITFSLIEVYQVPRYEIRESIFPVSYTLLLAEFFSKSEKRRRRRLHSVTEP